MLRTLAVLLLLLGLATVTPVVCLCAPSEAAGLMIGQQRADAAGSPGQEARAATDERVASGQSLLATSAAAVVASLIAAAAGLPVAGPGRLPRAPGARWLPLVLAAPVGLARPPTSPPPR
jgi:hypothetical protein